MTPPTRPPTRGAPRRVADLARAADPGGTRTRTTVRSLLAAGLTGGTAFGLFVTFGLPVIALGPAALVALLGVVTLPPGPPRRWAPTVTTATWAAAVVAAVAGDGPLGLALVLVTCVAGAAGAYWGPVGQVAGLLAFLTHVLSLRLGLGTQELVANLLALTLAAPAVLLTVLVLVPARPVPTARRLVRDLYAQVSRVADAAERLLLDGPGGRRQRRLRLRLIAAQEIALQVDDTLQLVDTEHREELRRAVLDVEALADHLVWAALVVPPTTTADDRALLTEQLRTGRVPTQGTDGDADPMVPDLLGGTDRVDEVVDHLAVAAEQLRELGRLPDARPTGTDPSEPPPPSGVGALVLRVGIASTIALLGGLLVDTGEWHWAVIGAYIVVTTTASRGAGLRKALDRALGTVVGVAAGLAVAAVLDGSAALVAFAVATAAFVWVFRASYALFMVALTIAVALLYELTGQLTVEVLALRLVETVVGAAAAAVVVSVVLPIPTGRTVDGAVDAMLGALDALLDHLAVTGACGAAEVRAVDRAVSELRMITEPVAAGSVLGLGRDVRAARLLATALRVRTGALATATTLPSTVDHAARVAAIAVVRDRVAQLRQHLAGDTVHGSAETEVPEDADPVLVVLRAFDDRCTGYATARGLQLRQDPGALAAGSASARD